MPRFTTLPLDFHSTELDDSGFPPDYVREAMLLWPLAPHLADLEAEPSALSDMVDMEDNTAPHIDFSNVLDLICDTFPEACVSIQHESVPLAPGMPALSASPSFVDLRRSYLFDFTL